MSDKLGMDRQVSVTFDLATLLLFDEVTGFAGFHDPILDHLTERQQQALWAGQGKLAEALRAAGVQDWDAALAAAETIWDQRQAGA